MLAGRQGGNGDHVAMDFAEPAAADHSGLQSRHRPASSFCAEKFALFFDIYTFVGGKAE